MIKDFKTFCNESITNESVLNMIKPYLSKGKCLLLKKDKDHLQIMQMAEPMGYEIYFYDDTDIEELKNACVKGKCIIFYEIYANVDIKLQKRCVLL